MTDQDKAAGVLAWLKNNTHSEISLKTKMGGYFPYMLDFLRPIAAGTHVIVPIEPTEKMKKVGIAARWQSPVRDANNVSEIYRTMLKASQEGEK